MKLRFQKDVLAYATAVTSNVANPQSSLQILANILIRANENGVTFEASDMESCVRCSVEGEVLEPGEITVLGRTFNKMVQLMPDGPIELDFSKPQAVISGAGIEYTLATHSAEDFPVWPELQTETELQLEQATLKRILGNILFALPTRDPRKVLLGALFDLKGDDLICVATDGKKLGFSRTELGNVEGARETNAIIPQKILHATHGQLRDEGNVGLRIGPRQVAFDFGKLVFLSNRIDGMFPNYEMVIPSDFTRELRLHRQSFLEAVNRAAITSEERNNSIIMRFQPGQIVFRSHAQDLGSYTGKLEVPYEGDPFDIAFNHSYLTESLRVIDSDEIVMKIKQPTAPVVFVVPEDERSLFLVMPIKLTDLPEFSE